MAVAGPSAGSGAKAGMVFTVASNRGQPQERYTHFIRVDGIYDSNALPEHKRILPKTLQPSFWAPMSWMKTHVYLASDGGVAMSA